MKAIVITIASILMSVQAWSLPLPKPGINMTIPSTFTKDYDFEGIVALNNCSGGIVRFENSRETDQAMVLTNGHCYEGGMPDNGEFVANEPSQRRFTVLGNEAQNLGTVRAEKVLYASMTKTDISLYLLRETFSEIKSQFNVTALTLSSKHPEIFAGLEIISGYWKRGYRCSIEKFVDTLQEAGWTMNDSIRFSRPGCETIGGTSGAPLIQTGTRTVIGVNNTGNESGRRCTMNNPCEIDSQGNVTFVKGYSYGQQTYWIYTCLNSSNQFDLNVTGCELFH